MASASAGAPPPPPAAPASSSSSSSSGPAAAALLLAWRSDAPGGTHRLQVALSSSSSRSSGGGGGGGGGAPENAEEEEEAEEEEHLVEYSLRDISYQRKSATCHELKVLDHPDDDPLAFHFEDAQEAQKWWTVLSSCLQEVHQAPEGARVLPGRSPHSPLATMNAGPMQELEASSSLELARKEELALRLSAAVELGDEEEAVRWATALAQQRTPLRVLLKESCYPTSEISLKVHVEDALHSARFTTRVHAFTTIAALRQQVFQDYEFHPSVQRWIIGQCLCVDDRTLGSYGIRKDGDVAFLYLLTAKGANLSEQRYREDKDWVVLQPTPSSLANGAEARHKHSTLPNPPPKKGAKDGHRKMDIGEISQFLGSLKINNLLSGHTRAPPPPPPSHHRHHHGCPSFPCPGWLGMSCLHVYQQAHPPWL
ncbi:hypothetical protein JRQ81_011021 [Phrynocephalus forsythii]|uniref:Sharpin n=1 Tax=Phrynocephalus forsythii TaxID=171643 RepID=A0A9Q1B5N0_9SAUR|nr:hypothetical protein JRQ81_011021 [Phrynocephalus forsythii]